MNYLSELKFHYKPEKGWINDPNGLVYFKGYYHIFYQHSPNFEVPWKEPMHWGHARTKDFLSFEELPVALFPDKDYDNRGCWSGSAIVKDDALYLVYSSVTEPDKKQTVSVAFSHDGISFEKYASNPVIECYPEDGGPDFRDPAICRVGDEYFCVMATGKPEKKAARLLLYKSRDLFNWKYVGIMSEWDNCIYAECPSLIPSENGSLLSASVCPLDKPHYFSVSYGEFNGGGFAARYVGEIDKGPDQYAGQIFRDHLGRNILIAWIPGWRYQGFAERDVGCMSAPREIKFVDGRLYGYPIKELWHLLKDSDPCLERTESGFVVKREGREPLVYKGEITDLKILRDEYIAEIFINGGEKIFTVLL